MAEYDYLAGLADRITLDYDIEPVIDPEAAPSTVYSGASTSGVVQAEVSGALALTQLHIAHLHSPETLGHDVVEAVNAAMDAAAQAFTMPDLDNEIAERVAAFDKQIDLLDQSMADVGQWLESMHAELGIEPLDEPTTSSDEDGTSLAAPK